MGTHTETKQHYSGAAERNLNTLKAVAEILQYPYKSVETEAELVEFEKNIKAAAENKMRCIQDTHAMVVNLVNATGIESEHPDFISGHQTGRAIDKINSNRLRLQSLHKEVNMLADQRDAFEKLWHDETDSNNRLLEKVHLYRDALRDWIAAARASQRKGGFFRRLFGLKSGITDADRDYAKKETWVIRGHIDDAVKPPEITETITPR